MKFKPMLLIMGSLLVLAAPVAHAQTAPAVQGSDAASSSDPAKARRLVLAKQLVELDGTITGSEQATAQIMPLMTMALNGQEAFRALPKTDQTKINELMAAEFKAYFIPKLIEATANYYAEKMSEAELEGTIAAIQQPHLKAYTRVRTQLTTDMQTVGGQLGQETAGRAMSKYLEWKSKQQ